MFRVGGGCGKVILYFPGGLSKQYAKDQDLLDKGVGTGWSQGLTFNAVQVNTTAVI